MKKLFSILAVLMFTTLCCFAASAPKVNVDGSELSFSDQGPIVVAETGRTLIPVRAVAEACGADVDWNEDNKSVQIIYDHEQGKKAVKLFINSTVMWQKDVGKVKLEQPAIIVNGRTMVPARAVFEALGMHVSWDSSSKTVLVSTTAQKNGTKTLLVDSNQSKTQTKSKGDLMDFVYYSDSEISFNGKELTDGGTCVHRSFKAKNSSLETIKEYINLLCDEYEFELVGEPYYQHYEGSAWGSPSSAFFDFVLKHTGDKKTRKSLKGNFTENKGDLVIWGTIERDSLKGTINYDSALTASNDGYKLGSNSANSSYIGESINTGLYRLANGDYQTQDGRFTAKSGQAIILEDGKKHTYNARYELDIDSQRKSVIIENNDKSAIQHFYISDAEDWAVGIYDAERFIVDRQWAIDCGGNNGNLVPDYIWETMFAHFHADSYVFPVRGLSGIITGLNLRLMYIDNNTAVFYSCATYNTKPYTVETFIAVPINVEPKKNQSQGTSSTSGVAGSNGNNIPEFAKLDCITCGGSGDCRDCGGYGKDYYGDHKTKCNTCYGSGNCRKCGGSGKR